MKKYVFRIKTSTSPKGFLATVEAENKKSAEIEISWLYRWSKDQKLVKIEE